MKQTFLVSDESVNSYGFKVLTEGIDTSRFEKNPVMLLGHERNNVIGYWENLKKEDGKMFADAVFDLDGELGKTTADKVEKGFLKATSLGLSHNTADLKDNVLEKSILYEISIVPIGSNQNTLKLYEPESLLSLYFSDISGQNELAKLLNLSSPAYPDILQAVKELYAQNKELSEFKAIIQEKENKEKDALIEQCIREGRFTAESRKLYRKMLDLDYKGTVATLNKIPKKRNFSAMITNPKPAGDSRTEKSKELWTLQDYRKFAPKELETNPNLYKELVDKEYNNKF